MPPMRMTDARACDGRDGEWPDVAAFPHSVVSMATQFSTLSLVKYVWGTRRVASRVCVCVCVCVWRTGRSNAMVDDVDIRGRYDTPVAKGWMNDDRCRVGCDAVFDDARARVERTREFCVCVCVRED